MPDTDVLDFIDSCSVHVVWHVGALFADLGATATPVTMIAAIAARKRSARLMGVLRLCVRLPQVL
jgi:hypothetical protein